MKPANLPELLANQNEIRAALAAGQTHEEILLQLRTKGVATTLTRVIAFCDSLGAPEFSEPRSATAPQRFPELEAQRDTVVSYLQCGCKADETWAVLTHHFNVETTVERVGAYMDQLLQELYPAGPIQRRLFELKPGDGAWENSSPVLTFGEGENLDTWTVGDFCQGVGVFGATGSGKSSGSGKTLLYQFIEQGFGGLVLTTKTGEADDVAQIAAACQRGSDFNIVRFDGPLRLNLLQYEMERPGRGAEFTESLVAFFKNLLSVMTSQKGQVVNQNFWQLTGDQLLRNLIGCFLLAKQPLTLDALCEFVSEAPTNEESAKEEKWRGLPVFGECLARANENARSAEDRRIYRMLCQYWLHAYPTLAPETRSCITISFSAMLDALRARHIYDLVSSNTTITPELILNGGIVALDLPLNEFGAAGQLVQAGWKYHFQRAILRRADKSNGKRCRPCFLYEDEAQNHLIDFDAEFQSRARDCRIARVMLTQNLNCLYERFGGDAAAKVKVDAILGNLNTKIFHANGDPVTNKYASDLIGTDYRILSGSSATEPNYPGLDPLMDMLYRLFKRPVITNTKTPVREPIVHPHEFSQLLTGGPENDCIVSGIAVRVGRPFANGCNHTTVAFQQPVPFAGTSSGR